ncbi:hypothetical protein LUZ61_000578 [Rhynchospora tenuis]|uniref:Cytochrome P450 n=1 Tax=Rhynchospora tenuis TaxID=198213 RepID=A0AAD5ZFE9_9POAL|nr:hypothetical protein LUZ61_000578 [Rhynchospora tenuis]
MDQLISYCLISTLFFLLLLLKLKTNSKPSLRLPPGPWTLPILGSIHHLIGSLPFRVLRDLSQQHGGLMFLQLGEQPTVVISSPELAREIMKVHDATFATRNPTITVKILTYYGKDVAFTPYGDYWRQVRKICILELLSLKRVQSFRSIREEETVNLIELISSLSGDGKLINLSDKIFSTINDMSFRAVVGNKCKNQDIFLRELQKAFDLASGFNLVDLFPSSYLVSLMSGAAREATRCHRELDQLLDAMIEEHRNRKGGADEVEDLLGVLLRLYDEDPEQLARNMDAVKAVIFDAFAASSETTAAVVDWAMFELMRSPLVMKKVQSEIRQLLQGQANITDLDLVKLNFLHLVIKETLRLHPPFPLLLPRECRETCCIFGYDIPQGATVIVNAWAIGRDPKYWKDAEEFKPERFIDGSSDADFKGMNFEFIPFGAGHRICPGMSFGLANIEIVLANLLYHFDWELPAGVHPKELDTVESYGLSARKKADLILRAIPHVTTSK